MSTPDNPGVSVACAVVTVSEPAGGETGQVVRELLVGSGHRVVGHEVVPDQPMRLKALLLAALSDGRVQAVITTGGTRITARDGTIEMVESLLEKKIDGFAEVFRLLAYQEMGTSAMMSRAIAGVCRGRLLISLPADAAAVRLAMEKLVLPELQAMMELTRP